MRRRAIVVLERVDAGQAFAQQLLRGDDPPFVRELVLGVLRRRLTLDSILSAFLRTPLHELEPRVRAALRAGLYQLIFLDGVPPHAALHESVAAVGKASARGFVNGVLRAITREMRGVPPDRDRGGASPTKRLERPGRRVFFFSRAVFPDPEQDRTGWLAAVHSHPRELVQRWVMAVGEDVALERMVAGNATPPLVLRPRKGRADAEALVAALARENQPAGVLPRAQGDDAVQVGAGAKGLLSGRAFRKGLFSVQDAAQMDAAEILSPRPGETIWDACAAPGGKACHLAELVGPEGCVLASDVSTQRLSSLEQNAARLGLDNLRCATHDLLCGSPPRGKPERGFDAILLDAPCSNTAVLARRPEARWRFQEADLQRLAEQQASMLEAARSHLAPGGRLIYSVCSFEPEEGAGHGFSSTRSPFVFRWSAPSP